MKLWKKKHTDEHKTKTSPDLWVSYQDEFRGYPISVKVNIKQGKKPYRHTLYVMIPYLYRKEKPFPDEQELAVSRSVKDQVDHILDGHENIRYIGNTAYKGDMTLLYVSNDEVDWLDLIQVKETVTVGKYENDQMKYFDHILYPPHIRKLLSENNEELNGRLDPLEAMNNGWRDFKKSDVKSKYEVAFSFKFDESCFWFRDYRKKQEFGRNIGMDDFPLSEVLKNKIDRLQVEYDTLIDWSSFDREVTWTEEHTQDFLKRANEVYEEIKKELAPEYEVINEVWDNMKKYFSIQC